MKKFVSTRIHSWLLFFCALTSAQAAVDFQKEVAPILESMCIKCHNDAKSKGDLKMHNAAGFAAADHDELLNRIALPADDEDVMPPKGPKLNETELSTLTTWIKEGANFPDGVTLKEAEPKKTAKAPREEDSQNLVSVEVFPAAIDLTTKADHQTIVVMAKYADDTTRDITEYITFTAEDPALVDINGNKVLPKADGESKIRATFFDKQIELPLKVAKATEDRPISFQLDVMPVFMRSGCNTGSCHGAASGKDGFRLSLFGFDPDGDHFRITKENGTRRINLALSSESMLVEKSTEAVPHTGGKLFEKGSQYYNTLVAWLEAGAPNDNKETLVKPVSLEVLPKQIVLEGVGATQQMTAIARYSDGTDRDVTSLVVFQSNNAPTADVTKDGLVTAGQRGEAFVMGRFETFTVGSQVIVIPKNLEYQKPAFPANNFIDDLVAAKLHKLRIHPSDVCNDEVFLRRASIDITGTIPTEEQYTAFLADTAPDKREKLVDTLLTRKEFTELWVMKWAELLQIRAVNVGGINMSYKATLLYYNWLQERIAKNVPFNQIVQELLASTGGTFANPASNYYELERDTLKVTENVAQVFMGMRLQCAQCHNHPFDRWTQNDYYQFAAFFSQIGRKTAEDPRETVVFNSGGGEMKHPLTQQDMKPKFLGADIPEIKPGEDRRKIMADWMASPQNPFFSRNLANLVWSHFFGVGIIEPVDDVRVSNPASNPELLDTLAATFTEYNYDFKRLVRDICTSRTYQLSTQTNATNEGDTRNFAHSLIRRMRAEVLLDAIAGVTETKNKFKGLPLGARAVQIADGSVSNYFLQTFGRAERATVCSCEVKMDPNLGQALHLINGENTGKRVSDGKVIKTLLDAGKKPEEIITALYIRTFARQPTPDELTQLTAKANEDPMKLNEALDDIFWALLNSKEFMFNH
jgi:cytochrome c553